MSDGSGILLPWCLPFPEGDGCKSRSNERVLGLEAFTRLSISTHLPAVSLAHLGNTLINSEDWGLRDRQMQPTREEGPGRAGDGQGGMWASVYQGGQRTSIVSPTQHVDSSRLCLSPSRGDSSRPERKSWLDTWLFDIGRDT